MMKRLADLIRQATGQAQFVVAFLVVAVTAVVISLEIGDPLRLLSGTSDRFLFVLLALVLTSTIFTLRTYITTATQHPRSLSIALVGPPAAGKTVYLTMLFRELESREVKGLSFAPYGTRTIEEVSANLTLLRNGEFPPRTFGDAHFRYEAIASYGPSFLSRRYRIQIDDYAGEHLGEFDASSAKWVHRSEFFEYVVSSDSILFMIDCERLLMTKGQLDPVPALENALVATLQTLIEKRNEDPTKPFEVPVGLIISKADLLAGESDMADVLDRIPRLITVCRRRCRFFKIFFASSLGHKPGTNEAGFPVAPPLIEPQGVVDPLIWLMGK